MKVHWYWTNTLDIIALNQCWFSLRTLKSMTFHLQRHCHCLLKWSRTLNLELRRISTPQRMPSRPSPRSVNTTVARSTSMRCFLSGSAGCLCGRMRMRRSISTTISVILLRGKCSLLSAMHSHCLDENFQWQNFAWISFFSALMPSIFPFVI